MFDSKSTRKFSKIRVLIVLFFVVFISGYSFYQFVPSKGFSTTTLTKIETKTLVTTTTTTVIESNTTNSVDTKISTSVTNTATSSYTNTTSNSMSNTTTTLPSGPTLFTIPQSTLRNWFDLNSSDIVFSPSWTNVSYYILTNSTSRSNIGLLYLTTDVAPKSCWGYNGQISTLVLVNTTGFVQNLTIYTIVDSWGYKITQAWLNTYIGRSVFERLQIGADALPVTGATYSSEGVIDGVRDAGRLVVNNYEQANPSPRANTEVLILGEVANLFGSLNRDLTLQSELSVAALIGLFVAAVAAFELKSNKIRYGVYIGSILFLGFYAVRMVTIGDFVDFTSWIFPPFWHDTFWYVLYGGVLVTTLFWGRFYCGYLCPFGAFTDLLNRLSPVKMKVPYKYQSKLRYVKYILLAIVVFEILQGTILYQVEPFGTFFLFSGDTFAWIFLGLIIGSSIFIDRFYCTYICPAGAGLALLSWFRFREIKRWSECKKCMICANQCTRQAIKGDHISALECMNCRDCEKLYLNTKLCPHYSQQRVIAKKQMAE